MAPLRGTSNVGDPSTLICCLNAQMRYEMRNTRYAIRDTSQRNTKHSPLPIKRMTYDVYNTESLEQLIAITI